MTRMMGRQSTAVEGAERIDFHRYQARTLNAFPLRLATKFWGHPELCPPLLREHCNPQEPPENYKSVDRQHQAASHLSQIYLI